MIDLSYDSQGGAARVILSGNGTLFARASHDITPVTIGSVEGNGVVDISFRHLIVGSNNLSTVFSGKISGTHRQGTISKIGHGTWTLTGDNRYRLGTFIEGGTLVANNPKGSATGKSPVQVNRGILAGKGTVAGARSEAISSRPATVAAMGMISP